MTRFDEAIQQIIIDLLVAIVIGGMIWMAYSMIEEVIRWR